MTDSVTGGLADLIECMIARGFNGRQIWTELMDQHDYLVTCDSIRHYIRYVRSRALPAPEKLPTAPVNSGTDRSTGRS